MAKMTITGRPVRKCGLEMYQAQVLDIDGTCLHTVLRWSEAVSVAQARMWLDQFIRDLNSPKEIAAGFKRLKKGNK